VQNMHRLLLRQQEIAPTRFLVVVPTSSPSISTQHFIYKFGIGKAKAVMTNMLLLYSK